MPGWGAPFFIVMDDKQSKLFEIIGSVLILLGGVVYSYIIIQYEYTHEAAVSIQKSTYTIMLFYSVVQFIKTIIK